MDDMQRRGTSGILTVAKVRSAAQGRWLTENWPRGEGAFQVRKLSGERCVYYYRYTTPDGKQRRIALPRYDALGAPLSLAEARTQAKALAHRYTSGERDLKERIAYEEQKARLAREAEAAREREAQARKSATLGRLMTAYCDHLAAQGKSSAGEARSSIARHIEAPHPALWDLPAADIQPEQLTPILRRMVEKGLLSHANKVRSYIRAAYAAACNAPLNAKAPESLRELKITMNPARDLAVVQGARKTRDLVLSEEELGALWRRLVDRAGAGPAILRFYLLTGGQRFEQLARAKLDDVHDECLTLWDRKGRRETPRRHVIPLLPEAREAMESISPRRIGPYLISLNGGRSPCDNSAVTPHLKKVSRAMLEAGEVQHDFSFGVLRRTVETRLAAAGISSDVRAQLQSHGLGGVQSRHYDRHDYLTEKRKALETLCTLMAST